MASFRSNVLLLIVPVPMAETPPATAVFGTARSSGGSPGMATTTLWLPPTDRFLSKVQWLTVSVALPLNLWLETAPPKAWPGRRAEWLSLPPMAWLFENFLVDQTDCGIRTQLGVLGEGTLSPSPGGDHLIDLAGRQRAAGIKGPGPAGRPRRQRIELSRYRLGLARLHGLAFDKEASQLG
jgi:hypothetical protein